MADNRFEFRYTAGDVASAQRMRFLRSNQLKTIIAIWAFSSLVLLAPSIAPQTFGTPFASLAVMLEISLAYGAGLAVLLLAAPYFDYLFKRFWHMPLMVQFNEKQFRVSVVKGKSKGLRLEWNEVIKVDENGRVLILHYGTGNKYIIIPKTAFTPGKDGAPMRTEQRFRELLQRGLAGTPTTVEKPAAATDETDDLEEEA